MPTYTIKPPFTRMESVMQQGHKANKGHKLVSVLVSEDQVLWTRVRTCCLEAN